MKEIGIYVHIPFCKSKCNYCDFISYCDKGNYIEEYISAVQKEIKNVGDRVRFKSNGNYTNLPIAKTIYIGGGTPSFIKEEYIERILRTITTNFNVDKNAEITIEVNPGTVTLNKLKKYYDMSINRLSIGLQSSNEKLLNLIGRIHNFEEFVQTINYAKIAGFTNINADIMIGLPEQTIYDVEDTINKILPLNLTHISVYSLIVEPNTKIERMLEEGKIKLPDEEIERYMYWFAKRKLEENGFIHYEISNFSKIPFRSKHNVNCWNQKEYIGFGIAASSYENNTRYHNIYEIEKYIENIQNDKETKNVVIDEVQDKNSKMNEYMLLGMRKINGINITEFRRKFEVSPLQVFNSQLTKLLREGLIKIDVNNIRLSKKGLDLANLVWEEFIE